MRSYWIGGGHLNPIFEYFQIFKKKRRGHAEKQERNRHKEGHTRKEAEMGVMQLQAKNTPNHRKLEEQGRSHRKHSLADALISDF